MAKRKVKKQEEIVETCDMCGKPLGRQCVRTQGSAICAMSVDLPARYRGGKWHFYCTMKCQCAHSILIDERE